ncbi:transmembrane protein 268 isoform X4 [Motacilla alba alba]|uniref:transmembrane protein 268 isoform X4 n=1 Tax=Motacilla alba alba TaxID=1094192 RepID=UPI0018D554D4|nr:transmembrane protein 268 isoform X4 [Motacilla alba alba]
MAQKSQTGGTEKNGSSLLHSKSDFKEGALQWVTEPPQGRVLLVLSMDNTCPTSSFDMDLCADKLQSLGVQVPMDACCRLIQEGVLRPEVRRYLFYSSRGFQIAMAVVFYIFLWTNLYSTLQLCSLGHSWGAGVLVTLVALALTVLVILVIDGHQRKAGLRHRLNKLWVVMDVAVQPELGMEEEAPCEESPLLSRGVTLNKDPVTCSELLHLIPEGPPQVRRNIPLTVAPNHPQGISAPELIPAMGDTTFSSSRSTWKPTQTFSSPGAARRRRRKPLKT